ncbi:MAG: TRAP transporter small permease subunit [Candidatus Eisenbacteria bacterium]|nr:TRAP transporter small permease subunit [Candidatus Eisenbacteria bacterium]
MNGLFATLAPAGAYYAVALIVIAAASLLRWLVRRRWGASSWSRPVGLVEQTFLALLILGMVGLGMLQVVLRNLFHTGIVWVEPMMRVLVLWIGFAGAVTATGRLRHIQMDLLGRLLPQPARVRLLRLTLAAAAIICLALSRAAWMFLGEEQAAASAGLLGIPNWILMFPTFAGFFLCAMRFAIRALSSSALLASLNVESGPLGDGLVAPEEGGPDTGRYSSKGLPPTAEPEGTA